MSTSERVALVTGAGSGIGAAIATLLAARGHTVVPLDRDAAALAGTVERLGAARSAAVDITDAQALARALDGLDQLDVLVNAAGIATESRIDDESVDTIAQTLEVNLMGTLLVTRVCVPLLRRSSSPRILNIGSIQGEASAAGVLGYSVSKGGVHSLTRALAVDLAADGILVNALAPGFIDTPMAVLADGRSEYETEEFESVYLRHGRIPLRRPGTADEVAAAAEFLVSPANRYVTGAILPVDGGMGATF